MNPAAVKTDAEGGIDNSFGANVMPIFKSLPPEQNPSQNLTDAIAGGAETGLFRFVGLAGSANQSPVSAGFLGGAEFVGTPAWNTTDTWPVTAESVDGSPESPKVSLPSYVSEGTWVAHATGPIRLDPRLRVWQSSAIHELVIHEALVTAELSVSGTSLVAKNGIIAGVIDTEELVDALTKTLAKLDPTMCQGAMLESMAEQLRAASDIMKDGTNGDPSQSCDGISVGIGFEAITAMIGPVAEPVPPSPNPCAN
jgi:hypothetical protein